MLTHTVLGAALFVTALGVAGAQEDAAGVAEHANPLGMEALYRADVVSNLSGGLKRGTTVLGNLDLKLTADLEALGG